MKHITTALITAIACAFLFCFCTRRAEIEHILMTGTMKYSDPVALEAEPVQYNYIFDKLDLYITEREHVDNRTEWLPATVNDWRESVFTDETSERKKYEFKRHVLWNKFQFFAMPSARIIDERDAHSGADNITPFCPEFIDFHDVSYSLTLYPYLFGHLKTHDIHERWDIFTYKAKFFPRLIMSRPNRSLTYISSNYVYAEAKGYFFLPEGYNGWGLFYSEHLANNEKTSPTIRYPAICHVSHTNREDVLFKDSTCTLLRYDSCDKLHIGLLRIADNEYCMTLALRKKDLPKALPFDYYEVASKAGNAINRYFRANVITTSLPTPTAPPIQ